MECQSESIKTKLSVLIDLGALIRGIKRNGLSLGRSGIKRVGKRKQSAFIRYMDTLGYRDHLRYIVNRRRIAVSTAYEQRIAAVPKSIP